MAEQTTAEPWTIPGLTPGERVARLAREHNLRGVQGFAADLVAEAMCAVLEDAAREAFDMGFMAVGNRILALAEGDSRG